MNPARYTRDDLTKLQFALRADEWIILVKPEDDGKAIREIIPHRELFSKKYVEWFRARNANGCHIYGRPNSTRYILIDDVKQEGIDRLKQDGMTPTAIVETSPDNFQIWITVSVEELPIPIANQLAKLLEQRYSTDIGSADALHLGRLPGLRNKKSKYQTYDGDGGPLVKLRTARDNPVIPDAASELLNLARKLAAQKPVSSPSTNGSCAPTNSNLGIDPSRSLMTPDEAHKIYEAELEYQANRKDWKLPIQKGLRSQVDNAVIYRLHFQYGFDRDDLAALLQYESEKGQERGMYYVVRTVNAASYRN